MYIYIYIIERFLASRLTFIWITAKLGFTDHWCLFHGFSQRSVKFERSNCFTFPRTFQNSSSSRGFDLVWKIAKTIQSMYRQILNRRVIKLKKKKKKKNQKLGQALLSLGTRWLINISVTQPLQRGKSDEIGRGEWIMDWWKLPVFAGKIFYFSTTDHWRIRENSDVTVVLPGQGGWV